jgi:DNA-binding NarL/FixJ family response regulator
VKRDFFLEQLITLSDTTIRVVIAQSIDRPIARAGLHRLIADSPAFSVVGEAFGEEAVLALVAEQQPDIILLDVFECDEEALELLSSVASAHESARVVMLCASATITAQSIAVSYGALGIVRQDQSPETLYKAICSVHKGEIWLERSLAASVLQGKTRASHSRDTSQSKIATLTEREHEVIALVCQGLKNQTIAERLYVSEATVRHRLTSIFEKLTVSDRLELVIFAFRHNLAAVPR